MLTNVESYTYQSVFTVSRSTYEHAGSKSVCLLSRYRAQNPFPCWGIILLVNVWREKKQVISTFLIQVYIELSIYSLSSQTQFVFARAASGLTIPGLPDKRTNKYTYLVPNKLPQTSKQYDWTFHEHKLEDFWFIRTESLLIISRLGAASFSDLTRDTKNNSGFLISTVWKLTKDKFPQTLVTKILHTS